MSSVFTEYVRSLEPGGAPPDPESFAELWEALRAVLVSEMKKRGIGSSPPSYLGVYGWISWQEAEEPDPEERGRADPGRSRPCPALRPDDALDELTAECYTFIFLRRLRCLKAQLKVKANVDGLVYLNVRHFLHDTQKKYDPLGFRVFEVVQSAVRRLVAAGSLHLIQGPPKIRNETVLGFGPDCDPAAAEGVDVDEQVRTWNDDLLPDLVTARGPAPEGVVAKLEGHIARLPAQGIRAFRFSDLIDPLKADVRVRWGELFRQSQGEIAFDEDDADVEGDDAFISLVGLVQPDTGVEERDRFEKLTACVSEALDGLDETEKTRRGYLSRLWGLLCTYAADPGERELTVGTGTEDPGGHDLPSRRKIAELLRIPRDRLPGLYATLGRLVRRCQAVNSGRVSTMRPRNSRRATDEGGSSP